MFSVMFKQPVRLTMYLTCDASFLIGFGDLSLNREVIRTVTCITRINLAVTSARHV